MKLATTIGEMYAYTNSPAEAVRAYENSGFRYLDYSFYNVVTTPNHPFLTADWKAQIQAAKEAAQDLGMTFVQAHAPACELRGEGMQTGVAATVRSIEACGMLGISNMVIHSGFFPEIHYPEEQEAYFQANEPFFRALIPAMEEYGVRILFENTTAKHCPDRMYFPILGKDLNAFVDYMGHPLFGAAWDVGHANMDAIDHEKEILTMGKNLKAVHIHDNNGAWDMHTAPFLGTTDYDSLLRGLIASDYDGYFTFESDGFFKYQRNGQRGAVASNTPTTPLAQTPLAVKKAALSMLYTIGKTMLEEYGVYEE